MLMKQKVYHFPELMSPIAFVKLLIYSTLDNSIPYRWQEDIVEQNRNWDNQSSSYRMGGFFRNYSKETDEKN